MCYSAEEKGEPLPGNFCGSVAPLFFYNTLLYEVFVSDFCRVEVRIEHDAGKCFRIGRTAVPETGTAGQSLTCPR